MLLRNGSLKSHNKLSYISQRNGILGISKTYQFNQDPTFQFKHPITNQNVHVITMAHWVDIQHFDQNNINSYRYNTLRDYIDYINPGHIVLDTCPTRLQYLLEWFINNPKPDILTNEQLSLIINELKDGEQFESPSDNTTLKQVLNLGVQPNELKFELNLMKKKSRKMSRFIEKINRLDKIAKYRGYPIKMQKEIFIDEPTFDYQDLWYFELYWTCIHKYFSNIIPHYSEFKKEFYLSATKWRYLSMSFGEEISIALEYFKDDIISKCQHSDR